MFILALPVITWLATLATIGALFSKNLFITIVFSLHILIYSTDKTNNHVTRLPFCTQQQQVSSEVVFGRLLIKNLYIDEGFTRENTTMVIGSSDVCTLNMSVCTLI